MNHPNTENLQALIDRVDKSYYNVINDLCVAARKQALKLMELEMHQVTSQYVSLCNRFIEEIQSYLAIKKDHFMPYARTLSEKDKGGHDCAHCQGGCNLQHDMQLSELRQSHTQLKELINRVQMVALPLYSETIYPDVYRILRNNMALIENSLTELFSLEETRLIPRIIEAQKNINARN